MPPAFVPAAGDIVWLDFDPQAGHEQAGRLPALVLSPLAYNKTTGLMLCCPVTTKIKNYPFEVALAGNPASVALADHVKNLDWKARNARPKTTASAGELAEVRAKLKALVG